MLIVCEVLGSNNTSVSKTVVVTQVCTLKMPSHVPFFKEKVMENGERFRIQ